MHPISLEFQAFGPYKGYESICFKDLAQNGLFLICGETGSGKTMILDAITFALYGQSSGGTRDDLVQLRCNRCDPADPTFVRFVFEEKGSVYSFERRLERKRVNLSAKQSLLKLNGEGVWEPVFENCKAREMTAKAAEIIGLNYDQFRQVIILPQGKFEKLLTSKSDEKEAILVNIFGAEKWQKIADKYYENAKAKRDELAEIKKLRTAALQEEGCESLEELGQKAEDERKEMQALEEAYENAGYDAREQALSKERDLAGQFEQLHGFEKQLESLRQQEESIRRNEKDLKTANIAETVRIPADKSNEARSALTARKESLDDLVRENGEAEEAFLAAAGQSQAHEARFAERQGWERQKAVFETKSPVYETIDAQRTAVSEAEKSAASLKNKAETAKEKLDGAAGETKRSYETFAQAQDRTRELRGSYMAGITGFIAKDLEAGVPCPVCGSTEHPRKAAVVEGSATREDVDAAEAEEDRCKKRWEQADKERAAFDDAWKKQDAAYREALSDLESKRASYDAAKKNLIEGVGSLSDLKRKIGDLEKTIAGYDQEKETLRSAFETAKQKKDSYKARIETAKEELAKAEKAAGEADGNLRKVLDACGFRDLKEAANAMLSDKARKDLSEKIEQYKGSVKTVSEQLAGKRSELEGKAEPDTAAIRKELEEIAKAREEYSRSHATRKTVYERLQDKYDRLTKDNERYEAEIRDAEDDFTFAKNLRGDTGVGLQRYVLGILFSSVIKAANEMLKKVHGGRYQLFRTDEKTDGTNKRGLDLKVYDSYAGGSDGRSVTTLSGGEKFLASLALSIGMSAIAKTGGVNIDGIFIDEGFGSLDNDSIDDALDILGSIQKAHGMVGIISHVDVLRSNIPTKIQVVKTRETSTIQDEKRA